MTISAQIIKDSISPAGIRLITYQLRYPRFIHSELMTHRVFSRNASSSRAIPVEKMIADIQRDTAMPIHWGANQPGMQADQENRATVASTLTYDEQYMADVRSDQISRESAWLEARDSAIRHALAFHEAGYHKQIVNRILEPFMHINVVVTSTEWSNWFALRNHPKAMPEIAELARLMYVEGQRSVPKQLALSDWHLPYVDGDQTSSTEQVFLLDGNPISWADATTLSIARCASVSYKTVEGRPMTLEKAKEIVDKLTAEHPIHASPLEHQATPDHWHATVNAVPPFKKGWANPDLHGNFFGWCQWRKYHTKENINQRDWDELGQRFVDWTWESNDGAG